MIIVIHVIGHLSHEFVVFRQDPAIEFRALIIRHRQFLDVYLVKIAVQSKEIIYTFLNVPKNLLTIS